MGSYQNNLKRFQLMKIDAQSVGDDTKPTRFVISVENREKKPTILVAEQYTLSLNGIEKNSMDRKRKGYVKQLYTNSKNRQVGVGIDLEEIDKSVVLQAGKTYKGRNKRRIMNQIYNLKDKKNSRQVNIVHSNRRKRKKYKK